MSFREMLKAQYGDELSEEIIKGQNLKRKVSFRVNALKASNEEIEKVLNENKIVFKKVSWYDNAYIVENALERDLQTLEIYKEGKIYLQSLSSMLPPLILNPETGIDILDMAAAPGGKTTEICALTNNLSNVTACEMNKIRAERLKYNIEKQGATSCFVMKKDARNIDDFFKFDKILLDAPCSGSGTESFKEELIEKCSKIQETLLDKALKILKTGSEMVYSTCSILEQENENVVEKFIKQGRCEIVPINIDELYLPENKQLNSTYELTTIPLLPTKLEGTLVVSPNIFFEGFYIAKLRKLK